MKTTNLKAPPALDSVWFIHWDSASGTKHAFSIDDHDELARCETVNGELLYGYATDSVVVDGVQYDRQSGAVNSSTAFYNVKTDFIHEGSDPILFWDSPFVMQHQCEFCRTDWQLDEAQYLMSGDYICDFCKKDENGYFPADFD